MWIDRGGDAFPDTLPIEVSVYESFVVIVLGFGNDHLYLTLYVYPICTVVVLTLLCVLFLQTDGHIRVF